MQHISRVLEVLSYAIKPVAPTISCEVEAHMGQALTAASRSYRR